MEIDNVTGKTGLKSVLSELHDSALPVSESEAEQLDMLPLPLTDQTPQAALVEQKRGRGRPVGAKNKNSEAWREYLLSRYRNPLKALPKRAA